MIPANYNIELVQGDDWRIVVTLKEPAVPPATEPTPMDLTGYTIKACVGLGRSNKTILVTFTSTVTTPATGTVVLTATPTQTANVREGVYDWDLQMSSGTSAVRTLIYGKANVLGEVSK